MTRILAGAAVVAAALFLAPSPASTASFNCALANLPAELAVCNDDMLGSLDEQMAAEYFPLINAAPPEAALVIRAEQREWLKRRNACGYDLQCILGAYRAQLQRLGAWREAISGAPPDDMLEEEQDDSTVPYDDPDESIVPFDDPEDYEE